MSEDIEIKTIPLNQDLVLLVNRILDQNHQLIELNSRILEENARILTLLDFPKFPINSLSLSDTAKFFRK